MAVWSYVKTCGRGLNLRSIGCMHALSVTKVTLQLRYAACGIISVICLWLRVMVKFSVQVVKSF